MRHKHRDGIACSDIDSMGSILSLGTTYKLISVSLKLQPEQTPLYQLVEKHYPTLVEQLEFQGKNLPTHVHREFEAYLKCGRLEHGFLRVRCDTCHFERLVAFSCKKRGFCPSCGARRMAETAALLSDEVFPDVPLRQWVIGFPFPLRYLFAAHPQAMGKVLGIIYRAISTHLIHKAGYRLQDGATGAVTLIQRFMVTQWVLPTVFQEYQTLPLL